MSFEELQQRIDSEVVGPNNRGQERLRTAGAAIGAALETTLQIAEGSEAPQLTEAIDDYKRALGALGDAVMALAQLEQPLGRFLSTARALSPPPIVLPRTLSEHLPTDVPPESNPLTREELRPPDTSAARLIRAHELQQMLGTTRRFTTRLYPYMYGMSLGDTTHRFSATYAEAYLQWIKGDSPGTVNAEAFAHSKRAKYVVREIRVAFYEKVNQAVSDDSIALPDVMDILCLSRQAVFEWRDKGRLETFVPGHKQHLRVTRDSFWDFCKWAGEAIIFHREFS